MSLLSIIIPLYNKEEYILTCLNSTLDCKYDFEIIVVDDGSSDDSVNIVNEFCNKNPEIKIKLISQKNSGPSSARNNGVNNASGKYILFLDADDYLNKNSLNYLMKFAIQNENVDMIEFDFSTSDISVFKPNIKYTYNSKIKLIKDLLNKKNIKSVVCGTLFKTDICKKISFNENMKWGEDSCYKLDYILRCNSGLYISSPYYVNRILYNNTLSRQKVSHEMMKSVISYINYYEKMLRDINVVHVDLCNRLFKTCVSYIRLCTKSNKKEYLNEIIILKEKCLNYLKYIKIDSFKHCIYFYYSYFL